MIGWDTVGSRAGPLPQETPCCGGLLQDPAPAGDRHANIGCYVGQQSRSDGKVGVGPLMIELLGTERSLAFSGALRSDRRMARRLDAKSCIVCICDVWRAVDSKAL